MIAKKGDVICDITFTGKNNTGNQVYRVFPGDDVSHITGGPIPRLALALNPLDSIANPGRDHRENRSCGDLLVIKDPIPPPISAKNVKIPEPFQKRITTLFTLIADIPGFNTHIAGKEEEDNCYGRCKEGEEVSLDGMLITRTGQNKMIARVENAEVLTPEQFLPRKEEWEQHPGFSYTEDPEEVETLTDGTIVYNHHYRTKWEKEARCRFDKVKCLVGGVKGVTRPVEQLYVEIKGELVPVDMVISEMTILSKGAKNTVLYPLAALAGIKEIDPKWKVGELVDMVEEGLISNGLPSDGRFPVYIIEKVPVVHGKEVGEETCETLENLGVRVNKRHRKVQVGTGITGPLPWVRPCETELRQSSHTCGLSLNIHSRILGGVDIPYCEATKKKVEKVADFFYRHVELAEE